MKKLGLILLLCLSLLTGCQSNSYKQFQKTTLNAGFDTLFILMGYSKSESDFNSHFSTMENDLIYYNKLFDKYNNYSNINNIKTINDQAGLAPVVVDDALLELLLLSKEWYDKTNGVFDVTLGAVLNIWHEYREEGMDLNDNGEPGNTPTKEELEQAKQYTGWNFIEIDEVNKTVYINNENASLDVGAVAKGFAVEKVAQKLEQDGLKYGVINGGGNVRTINTKPDKAPWNIGIANPNNLGGSSADVIACNQSTSVVTSGDYQRYYYDKDENRLHHIIDPRKLWPSNVIRSVSVIHDNSAESDILSTTLYILEYTEAKAFIEKLNKENPEHPIGVVWFFDEGKQPEGVAGKTKDGIYEIITDNLISQSNNFKTK